MVTHPLGNAKGRLCWLDGSGGYIFLDVDGVLHPDACTGRAQWFDEGAMRALGDIARAAPGGAPLVLS